MANKEKDLAQQVDENNERNDDAKKILEGLKGATPEEATKIKEQVIKKLTE